MRGPDGSQGYPQRKRPAEGVFRARTGPTIVYVTVCTKDRVAWLASEPVHRLLRAVWQGADAWLVGRYTIMPDHLHLFVAPNQEEIELKNWVGYWKRQFSEAYGVEGHKWQSGQWDRRLRSCESYEAKWAYVRDNPVRGRLVERAEDWPYQGELTILPW